MLSAKMKKREHVYLVQAIKIMLGSSGAMYIAMLLNLEFATSAGIITLLTILTTKRETLRLSLYRIITYIFAAILSILIFQVISSIWIAFGVYIFLVVFFSELVGWRATISVNAVVGTHFLTTLDFSPAFFFNELMLVIIGIAFAIVLNIYNANNNSEKRLKHNMQFVDMRLQSILIEMAQYLNKKVSGARLEEDLSELEDQLKHFIEQSCEHAKNTFRAEGDYYELYFEMRLMQCSVLNGFQSKFKKMREIPEHVHIVADYMLDMKDYVIELNDPTIQIEELEQLSNKIFKGSLPETKKEYESNLRLYYILMDLEDFLMHKKRFVESVRSSQIYNKEYYDKKAELA